VWFNWKLWMNQWTTSVAQLSTISPWTVADIIHRSSADKHETSNETTLRAVTYHTLSLSFSTAAHDGCHEFLNIICGRQRRGSWPFWPHRVENSAMWMNEGEVQWLTDGEEGMTRYKNGVKCLTRLAPGTRRHGLRWSGVVGREMLKWFPCCRHDTLHER